MVEPQPAQRTPAEHTSNPHQEKPLGSDSTSYSPTPQSKSPPSQKDKGKAPMEIPPTPPVELDSEDTVAVEEDSRSIPLAPLAPTLVKRRSIKRTAGHILAKEDEQQPSQPP
ncbi:hypothetical protein V6N11_001593 [Hibiscus sabdariffa]|uniref:Uncharacterized protein n=1 Tax=Hibiscus sabdariffa TaxID=183260 RepID=A0ABR2S0P8_9ROSI